MVDSMSECPSHCCTVRRSTPAHSDQVANVALNLCSQKFRGLSLTRSATAFRVSRKSSFGLHPAVGKTSPQLVSALAFAVFNFLTSLAGMGTSRSR